MGERMLKLILPKKQSPIPTLTRKTMVSKLMLRMSCDWREKTMCIPAATARRKAELTSLLARMMVKMERYRNRIGRKVAVA